MSPEWRSLRDRRMDLRKALLPRRFSKLGSYTDKQRYDAAAFRFLFNAELESYFESLAKIVAKHAEDRWKGHKEPTVAMITLCARNSSSVREPSDISSILSTRYLDRKFNEELLKIRQLINNNNGAKSHNILKMFVPLGIDETSLDPSLTGECDALGVRRGAIAHKSSHGVIALIDPRDEFDKSASIVVMLKEFEKLLDF